MSCSCLRRSEKVNTGNSSHWLCSFMSVTSVLSRWVVCQAPCSVSATVLRRQLHWFPVRQRISYKPAVITYKTNSTKTPAYLSDIIHEYHPTRTLRSADKLLLAVPRIPITLSAKAFCVSVRQNCLTLLTVNVNTPPSSANTWIWFACDISCT